MFGQIYKLLRTYSLIKPLKNSNVSGTDLMNNLLTASDINNSDSINSANCRKRKWSESVKDVFSEKPTTETSCVTVDHDYTIDTTDKFSQSHFAGYIASKKNVILSVRTVYKHFTPKIRQIETC